MIRANWIGAPEMFRLNQAARVIVDAYGMNLFLVGSALERRDHRDVDLRCILDDAEFDTLFPGSAGHQGEWLDARWSLLCASISLYLSQCSGLRIDFQFQRRSQANAENDGPRQAIGIFISARAPASEKE